MPSSAHAESASSSSSTLLESERSMEPGLEEQVKRHFRNNQPHILRNRKPQEGDEEALNTFHMQLGSLINGERNSRRRRSLMTLLSTSTTLSEQLLFLRKYRHSTGLLAVSNYFTVMRGELTDVMNQSFEDDYRKLADCFGFLETIAEVLVLDVETFGVKCSHENLAFRKLNITVRKLVANALTNLTYGDLHRKQRLCSYPNFVETVVRNIDEMQNLAQVYAALLRNLSWNADSEMNAQLCLTVPALAQASLRAYEDKDFKCLCATLSALWNLSFSVQNQKAICEHPRFLEVLVDLLIDDPQHTPLVESATGVLKYASQFFSMVRAREYLSANATQTMVLRLIDLLKSSSFTTITNCLWVLLQLLKNDFVLRTQVRMNLKAMQTLRFLRDSKHKEVNNAIKTILDKINETDSSNVSREAYGCLRAAASPAFRPDGMMSSYSGVGVPAPSFFDSSRLLKLRSMQTDMSNLYPAGVDPNGGAQIFNGQAPLSGPSAQYGFAPRPGASQAQFNSLPRQCYQNNNAVSAAMPQATPDHFGRQLPTSSYGGGNVGALSGKSGELMESGLSQSNTFTTTDAYDIDFDASDSDPFGFGGEDPSFDVEESVQCTRGSSVQSLSSLLPIDRSAWESCNNSAVNSNRLSPVSASELPDSPTQCTSVRNREASPMANLDVASPASGSGQNTGSANAPSDGTEQLLNVASGLRSLSLSEEQTDSNPGSVKATDTRENFHSRQSSTNDEDDYGSFSGAADSELLNQSIEAAMPKRVEVNDDFLADMIEQAQPKPSPQMRRSVDDEMRNFSSASTARMHSDSSSMRTDEEDFLQQSINNVLPPQNSVPRRSLLPAGSAYKRRIF